MKIEKVVSNIFSEIPFLNFQLIFGETVIQEIVSNFSF